MWPTCVRNLTILASVIPDIWLGPWNLNWITQPVHAHFRDGLSSVLLVHAMFNPHQICCDYLLRKYERQRKMYKLWSFGVVRGHSRSSAMLPIDTALGTYDFLIDFNTNCASIYYHFRVIASYLSKVANFNLPHPHFSSPLGVTPFEFSKVCAIVCPSLAM